MTGALPPEVRVEMTKDGVTYFLPRRPLRNWRWFGIFLIGFSCLFVSSPVSSVCRTVRGGFSHGNQPFNLAFLFFEIAFITIGLFPMFIGLLVIFGKCRVQWRGQKLSGVEELGIIRWRRRLNRRGAVLQKLAIGAGVTSGDGQPVTSGPLAQLGGLLAQFDRGNPRFVVIGYPKSWLEALARDFSSRLAGLSPGTAPPEIEIVDTNEKIKEEVVQRPADSPITVEQNANGLTLVIPPAGVRQGSKGLFAFAILWCTFMAVGTGLVIKSPPKSGDGNLLVVVLFFGFFWAVGIAMMVAAVNMGRRRALIQVDNSRLQLAQQNLFGKKAWSWSREEIAAIRTGASGMEVNDVPVVELQVHLTAGKKTGFFGGRPERELDWLAFELRNALQVPANK